MGLEIQRQHVEVDRCEPRAARSVPGDFVRSVLALALLPPVLGMVAAGVGMLALCGAPTAWIDRLYRGFARLCLRIAGTRVDARGLEALDPDAAYVIVANHESLWDPVVLTAVLPLRVRFVMKDGLNRVPVLGWALRRTGNVVVVRHDTTGDVARLREGTRQREAHTSLLFFAEGTRARDGRLHPFKKGAFATAITARLPVLPVAIAGTHRVIAPDHLRVLPGHVVVEVGPALAVDRLALDDREKLRGAAFETVRALRRRAQQRWRFLGRTAARTRSSHREAAMERPGVPSGPPIATKTRMRLQRSIVGVLL